MSWQRGDRVWYEPSEGVRFAGIVLGQGSCAGSVLVLLSGHYARWRWTNSGLSRPRPPYQDCEAPAIGQDLLRTRESYIRMDAEFSKREATDGG